MAQTDIILKNISKSFNDAKVLSDLNLTFKAGGTYCLMAPSGTGKTTLLKILMGLILPDSGILCGPDAHKISAVFQDDRLLEDYSALQNLRFVTGSLYSNARLAQWLSVLLPDGCQNQPVSEFSGGMKRRLSILRALLVPSTLILMDEPFAGLDRDTKMNAVSLIKKNTKDKLLIIATHNPEDAALLHAEIITLPMQNTPTFPAKPSTIP